MKYVALLLVLFAGGAERKLEPTAIQITCGTLVVIAQPPTEPTLAHVASMARCMGADPVCTIEFVRLKRNK